MPLPKRTASTMRTSDPKGVLAEEAEAGGEVVQAALVAVVPVVLLLVLIPERRKRRTSHLRQRLPQALWQANHPLLPSLPNPNPLSLSLPLPLPLPLSLPHNQ